MRTKIRITAFVAAMAAAAGMIGLARAGEEERAANPVVIMKTSMGTLKIELLADKAPQTVEKLLGLRGRKVLRRDDDPPCHGRKVAPRWTVHQGLETQAGTPAD